MRFKFRSTAIIENLLELVREQEREISRLNEQIVLMAEKPVVPVVSDAPARVYYMDDARVLEMEEEGNAPT